MKKITPDINLQNEIQKNKILETRDFYKGKSFRFAHEWHAGTHYFNDQFVTDFVVYNNVLLACIKSHTSSSDSIPTIIYDDTNPLQAIGVQSDYWEFVLSGIVGTDTSVRVKFSPDVESLPNAKEHVGEIYVVGPVGVSGNAYLEYIAIHTPSYEEEYIWELIGGGNTSIDLSNYVTKSDLTNYYTKTETDNNYATKDELSKIDLSSYATTEWVSNQGYISTIPDEYITEDELVDKIVITSIDGGETNFNN